MNFISKNKKIKVFLAKESRGFSFVLGKKYALDCFFFSSPRSFKDGITFFNLELNLDYFKGDHKPSFRFSLEFINCMIIEFDIYNMYHVEDEDIEM